MKVKNKEYLYNLSRLQVPPVSKLQLRILPGSSSKAVQMMSLRI
jgi:hypothetical protein